MKTKILFLSFLFLGFLMVNPAIAENEKRDVASFSEISLRISAKVYLKQGNNQSVEVAAKSSALEELITEVKDRKLIIRYKSNNFFRNSFNPGKVEIFVTVPEVDGLSVSGSGDIVAEDEIKTRILDLAISGSGKISIEDLQAERVKAAVSGSGDIEIEDGEVTDDLTVAISGSGGVKAENLEAENVEVKISGSGNCSITSNGSLNARIAGSGNVYYKGNPNVDSSVAGSGRVKKM